MVRRFSTTERRLMFRETAVRWYRSASESLVEDIMSDEGAGGGSPDSIVSGAASR